MCEMDRKAWETEGRTFIPGRNRTLVAAIRTKPCCYALYPESHWGASKEDRVRRAKVSIQLHPPPSTGVKTEEHLVVQ